MSLAVASTLVGIAAVYLAIGVAFGLWFVLRGVNRLDSGAAQGTWGFRVIILPGAAALWPLLAMRVARRAAPPFERTPHKRAAARPST